jgi:hypothetical protein
MEFGKTWPQAAPQHLAAGRWGQPLPSMEFGGCFPQPAPQDFGGRIPFIDQGWRSPRMPFPPGGSRYIH